MDSTADFRVGCGVCGKKVAPGYLFRHHQRYHTKMAKKFPCNSCPKEYYSGARLEDHIKGKHQDLQPSLPFFCDVCPKTFKTESGMFEYKTYMHRMTRASLPCTKFEKTFETKLALMKHISALHRELKYDECPKKLGSRRSLKEHKKRKHVNVEPAQVDGVAQGENTI